MTGRVAALVLVVLLVAGCGVPADDGPRRVQVPPGPFATAKAADPPDGPGRVDEPLCFVRGDRLIRVTRRVAYLPDVETHLRHLLAGPATADQNEGFTSALTGVTVTAGQLSGGVVAVAVSGTGGENVRSDDILTFGQVVCTLTSRPDVHAVSFLRDGQPIEVPRGDGLLSGAPLTAADYRSLVGHR